MLNAIQAFVDGQNGPAVNGTKIDSGYQHTMDGSASLYQM